jgi:cleavage stimulation factor subunit 3
MEYENNTGQVGAALSRALGVNSHLQLWELYLDVVKRGNDLANPNTRKVIVDAFETVLGNVGIDKDAGNIWEDYIQFVALKEGQIGGSNWQDKQKEDELRNVFQRAIAIPTQSIVKIWQQYNQFEQNVSKVNVSQIYIKSVHKQNPLTARPASKSDARKSKVLHDGPADKA